jgi:hypothetical protein
MTMTTMPNKSPEPTAVGAVRSAIAVQVGGGSAFFVRPLDHIMSFHISLILILSAVANLTWSLGKDVDSAVTYFVFPALLAVLVVFFWRSMPWPRQMLLVFGFLLLTEILRDIFVMHVGRQGVFDDPDNRVFILVSLFLEIGVSMITFGAAKLLISGYDRPVA